MEPVLQVALDHMHLKRALLAAKEAVEGGADWLEAGTPLIKSEGMEVVRELKKSFPGVTIVADLKTMDTGAFEVEIAAKAGADVITVMGVTDDATILEAVKAARRYGAKIMVDLMRVPDKAARAKQLETLGVDYLNMHVSIDEQMIAHTPLQELKAVASATSLPVAVAGGLNSETVAQAVAAGASILIVGGAIIKAESVAEAYLALLAERGVEYLFANAGTDFAPIVEAYAKAAHTGFPAPKPLIATHENLALSMAHGYAVASGKVPAVMVHVSVGTANALCGVFNAARANVPILFTAGRSPLTEEGLAGARDTYIHWAQEMFDQAGMLREMVKWDYELRNGAQLETVVDRALTLATSPPEGPVYLSLPREVLAEKLFGFTYDSPARRVAASPIGVGGR